jgi:dCTP deaminase
MPGAGFWSTETLKDRLDKEKIISPYDADAIHACCYELSVGEEVFVTGESTKKIALKSGDSVVIPPGQVVLILTRETLKMPLDAIGLLSIKFGFKARGLINISGFHVDPGFEGKLVFSMYNAGVQTIHLSHASPIFLLWLSSTDKPTADKYHGQHNKQLHLPDDAITNLAARMPSPFTLEKDVESLRNELRREVGGLKAILGVAGTLAITAFLASLRGCGPQSSSPSAGSVHNGSTPLQTSPITIASPAATVSSTIIPSATGPPDATVSPSQAPRP